MPSALLFFRGERNDLLVGLYDFVFFVNIFLRNFEIDISYNFWLIIIATTCSVFILTEPLVVVNLIHSGAPSIDIRVSDISPVYFQPPTHTIVTGFFNFFTIQQFLRMLKRISQERLYI